MAYFWTIQPYISFIPGKDNIIADKLSWLDGLEQSVLSKDKQVFVLKDSISNGMDFADNPLLNECFLHVPPLVINDTDTTDYQWTYQTKWYFQVSQITTKISR